MRITRHLGPRSAGFLLAVLQSLAFFESSSSAGTIRARTQDPVTIIASAQRAIETGDEGWVPTMERGDLAAIAAGFAQDGVFLTSTGTVIRGRAPVVALYRTDIAKMGPAIVGRLVQEGVTVSGGMICEWEHGWLIFEEKTGKRRISSAHYLTVWHRGTDSSRKVIWQLGALRAAGVSRSRPYYSLSSMTRPLSG